MKFLIQLQRERIFKQVSECYPQVCRSQIVSSRVITEPLNDHSPTVDLSRHAITDLEFLLEYLKIYAYIFRLKLHLSVIL